jgi:fatty acid desaturase
VKVPDEPRHRRGAIAFVAGVVAVAVGLAVAAAATSGSTQRGFVGMAVLWGAGAVAAVALVVAIERRT